MKLIIILAILFVIFNGYQPCITEPSRIVNGNNPSLVDNIFSNSVEKCISGNILDKISDHLPSFVIFQNDKNTPKPSMIKRRNMKNSDELKYQPDLLLLLRELQGNSGLYNAEAAYNFFHKKHCGITNKHYPIEVLTRKQQELELKPWITKGILTSTRVKSRLFRIFKKTKKNKIMLPINSTMILLTPYFVKAKNHTKNNILLKTQII